jgi:hypothetical protein
LGFGILSQTIDGLKFTNASLSDQASLADAFMLNDNGLGSVDLNAGPTTNYLECVKDVNALLDTGVTSEVCAEYVADVNCPTQVTNPPNQQTNPPQLWHDDFYYSGDGKQDYCVRFVDCKNSKVYPADQSVP